MKRIAIISLSCAAIIGASASCTRGGSSAAVQFELEEAVQLEARDFRFYVHDIALLSGSAPPTPLRLLPDSNWQRENLALIDLASSSGTARNAVLRGTIDRQAAAFDGVRFTVGVPFSLNHGNPLTASAPLDRGELFWTWQTGYKFMRIDLTDTSGEWSFHLGSTGCVSASAVRPPADACGQPNLLHVELRGFDPLRDPVRVRLDAFAEWMSRHGPSACTGSYAQSPVCAEGYALTGLSIETGDCRNAPCDAQRIFSVH